MARAPFVIFGFPGDLCEASHITDRRAAVVFPAIKQGRLHMRKFILISALLLASVSAQAGETRSLTLPAFRRPRSPPKCRRRSPKRRSRSPRSRSGSPRRQPPPMMLPRSRSRLRPRPRRPLRSRRAPWRPPRRPQPRPPRPRLKPSPWPRAETEDDREENPSRIRRIQGPPHRRQVWRVLVSPIASAEVP